MASAKTDVVKMMDEYVKETLANPRVRDLVVQEQALRSLGADYAVVEAELMAILRGTKYRISAKYRCDADVPMDMELRAKLEEIVFNAPTGVPARRQGNPTTPAADGDVRPALPPLDQVLNEGNAGMESSDFTSMDELDDTNICCRMVPAGTPPMPKAAGTACYFRPIPPDHPSLDNRKQEIKTVKTVKKSTRRRTRKERGKRRSRSTIDQQSTESSDSDVEANITEMRRLLRHRSPGHKKATKVLKVEEPQRGATVLEDQPPVTDAVDAVKDTSITDLTPSLPDLSKVMKICSDDEIKVLCAAGVKTKWAEESSDDIEAKVNKMRKILSYIPPEDKKAVKVPSVKEPQRKVEVQEGKPPVMDMIDAVMEDVSLTELTPSLPDLKKVMKMHSDDEMDNIAKDAIPTATSVGEEKATVLDDGASVMDMINAVMKDVSLAELTPSLPDLKKVMKMYSDDEIDNIAKVAIPTATSVGEAKATALGDGKSVMDMIDAVMKDASLADLTLSLPDFKEVMKMHSDDDMDIIAKDSIPTTDSAAGVKNTVLDVGASVIDMIDDVMKDTSIADLTPSLPDLRAMMDMHSEDEMESTNNGSDKKTPIKDSIAKDSIPTENSVEDAAVLDDGLSVMDMIDAVMKDKSLANLTPSLPDLRKVMDLHSDDEVNIANIADGSDKNTPTKVIAVAVTPVNTDDGDQESPEDDMVVDERPPVMDMTDALTERHTATDKGEEMAVLHYGASVLDMIDAVMKDTSLDNLTPSLPDLRKVMDLYSDDEVNIADIADGNDNNTPTKVIAVAVTPVNTDDGDQESPEDDMVVDERPPVMDMTDALTERHTATDKGEEMAVLHYGASVLDMIDAVMKDTSLDNLTPSLPDLRKVMDLYSDDEVNIADIADGNDNNTPTKDTAEAVTLVNTDDECQESPEDATVVDERPPVMDMTDALMKHTSLADLSPSLPDLRKVMDFHSDDEVNITDINGSDKDAPLTDVTDKGILLTKKTDGNAGKKPFDMLKEEVQRACIAKGMRSQFICDLYVTKLAKALLASQELKDRTQEPRVKVDEPVHLDTDLMYAVCQNLKESLPMLTGRKKTAVMSLMAEGMLHEIPLDRDPGDLAWPFDPLAELRKSGLAMVDYMDPTPITAEGLSQIDTKLQRDGKSSKACEIDQDLLSVVPQNGPDNNIDQFSPDEDVMKKDGEHDGLDNLEVCEVSQELLSAVPKNGPDSNIGRYSPDEDLTGKGNHHEEMDNPQACGVDQEMLSEDPKDEPDSNIDQILPDEDLMEEGSQHDGMDSLENREVDQGMLFGVPKFEHNSIVDHLPQAESMGRADLSAWELERGSRPDIPSDSSDYQDDRTSLAGQHTSPGNDRSVTAADFDISMLELQLSSLADSIISFMENNLCHMGEIEGGSTTDHNGREMDHETAFLVELIMERGPEECKFDQLPLDDQDNTDLPACRQEGRSFPDISSSNHQDYPSLEGQRTSPGNDTNVTPANFDFSILELQLSSLADSIISFIETNLYHTGQIEQGSTTDRTGHKMDCETATLVEMIMGRCPEEGTVGQIPLDDNTDLPACRPQQRSWPVTASSSSDHQEESPSLEGQHTSLGNDASVPPAQFNISTLEQQLSNLANSIVFFMENNLNHMGEIEEGLNTDRTGRKTDHETATPVEMIMGRCLEKGKLNQIPLDDQDNTDLQTCRLQLRSCPDIPGSSSDHQKVYPSLEEQTSLGNDASVPPAKFDISTLELQLSNLANWIISFMENNLHNMGKIEEDSTTNRTGREMDHETAILVGMIMERCLEERKLDQIPLDDQDNTDLQTCRLERRSFPDIPCSSSDHQKDYPSQEEQTNLGNDANVPPAKFDVSTLELQLSKLAKLIVSFMENNLRNMGESGEDSTTDSTGCEMNHETANLVGVIVERCLEKRKLDQIPLDDKDKPTGEVRSLIDAQITPSRKVQQWLDAVIDVDISANFSDHDQDSTPLGVLEQAMADDHSGRSQSTIDPGSQSVGVDDAERDVMADAVATTLTQAQSDVASFDTMAASSVPGEGDATLPVTQSSIVNAPCDTNGLGQAAPASTISNNPSIMTSDCDAVLRYPPLLFQEEDSSNNDIQPLDVLELTLPDDHSGGLSSIDHGSQSVGDHVMMRDAATIATQSQSDVVSFNTITASSVAKAEEIPVTQPGDDHPPCDIDGLVHTAPSVPSVMTSDCDAAHVHPTLLSKHEEDGNNCDTEPTGAAVCGEETQLKDPSSSQFPAVEASTLNEDPVIPAPAESLCVDDTQRPSKVAGSVTPTASDETIAAKVDSEDSALGKDDSASTLRHSLSTASGSSGYEDDPCSQDLMHKISFFNKAPSTPCTKFTDVERIPRKTAVTSRVNLFEQLAIQEKAGMPIWSNGDNIDDSLSNGDAKIRIQLFEGNTEPVATEQDKAESRQPNVVNTKNRVKMFEAMKNKNLSTDNTTVQRQKNVGGGKFAKSRIAFFEQFNETYLN